MSSSDARSGARRAERRERRERERRRRGAEKSDDAFGADDVAAAEAFAAARRDDVPELEVILNRGVMPRVTDVEGNTLLHAACSRGALRAAKLVVRWAVYSAHPPDRAFLSLRSANGRTALDVCRDGGHERMEEWLIALGATGSRGGDGAGALDRDGGRGGRARPQHPFSHHQLPPAGPYEYSSPYGGGMGMGTGTGMGMGMGPGGYHRSPSTPYGGQGVYPYAAPGSGWDLNPPRGPGGPGGMSTPFDLEDAIAYARGGGGGGDRTGGGAGDYLMGALETALGAGAEAARGGVQSEERRRAQAVVRQVAEALEDREEMADELDEAIARADAAEARAAAAEAAAAAATKEARDSVKEQRAEEQEAVLSALGLAEERAVQMAAECETLREEKDAIASALEYVNEEMETMRAREEATMQEFYRKGFAAGQAHYEELVKTHASRGQLEALGLTPTAPASASASGGGATTPSSPMASLMPTPEPFGTPVLLTGNGSMAGVTMTTASPTLARISTRAAAAEAKEDETSTVATVPPTGSSPEERENGGGGGGGEVLLEESREVGRASGGRGGYPVSSPKKKLAEDAEAAIETATLFETVSLEDETSTGAGGGGGTPRSGRGTPKSSLSRQASM